jgi:hypothetical protein
VVEAGVGEGSAETFVEEQEQERGLHAFGGKPIGVSTAIALEESMAFQLAQVVAELVQSVSLRREPKGLENGLVDLLGGPAPTVVLPCRRTSNKRMMGTSWMRMPG